MRVLQLVPAGSWDEARVADQVALDFEGRYRRRLLLPTESGSELLLDLPGAVRLRDGDGLVREDGAIVRVSAKREPLLEIWADSEPELLRIAWHLGNRHLPAQILAGRVRVRDDHVIAAMVQVLGGHAEPILAPFDPETGAYAAAPGHDHRHET